MSTRCPSGKRIFASETVAEDALIDLWSKNNYTTSNSPIAVYRCDDCGNYHLTSRGPMNAALAKQIENGNIKRQQEANEWAQKLKRKKF